MTRPCRMRRPINSGRLAIPLVESPARFGKRIRRSLGVIFAVSSPDCPTVPGTRILWWHGEKRIEWYPFAQLSLQYEPTVRRSGPASMAARPGFIVPVSPAER